MTVNDLDTVFCIDQTVQAYPWTKGNFLDAINSEYTCRVAVVNEKICGYAVLMLGVDEAELLTIGVSGSVQRQGFGLTMLTTLLDVVKCKARSRVLLEVSTLNEAAISMYQKVGFAGIGTRRGYYRLGDRQDDALIMLCDLSKNNG